MNRGVTCLYGTDFVVDRGERVDSWDVEVRVNGTVTKHTEERLSEHEDQSTEMIEVSYV